MRGSRLRWKPLVLRESGSSLFLVEWDEAIRTQLMKLELNPKGLHHPAKVGLTPGGLPG